MNRGQLQNKRVAYPNQSLDSALEAAANQQLLIHSLAAINGSAAPMDIGIGHSLPDPNWQLLVTANAVQTDQSDSIQAGTATSVLGTVNNDMFIVQAKDQFGLLSFNVSQAETGSPVYTYSYYNGSTYSTLTVINSVSYSATGRQCLVFAPPTDWAVNADGYYAVRVQATTAPSQAVQIDALKVCELLAFREEVLPKGQLAINFETGRQLLLQGGEEIIPFFAFSSSSNTMEASYQINP